MTWTRRQSCSNFETGSSVAATFSTANLTANSKLIAFVQSNVAASGQCTGISDGHGNNFTKIVDSGNPGAGFGGGQLWVLDTPAGDAGTKPAITATLDASTSTSLLVQEVSGLLAGTSGILDGTAGTLNNSTASGSYSSGSPSYSSTAVNEYLVSAFSSDSNGGQAYTLTAPGGYTADAALSGSNFFSQVAIAYGNSANGAESGGWSVAGANGAYQGWGVILVAFKLAPAGGVSRMLMAGIA